MKKVIVIGTVLFGLMMSGNVTAKEFKNKELAQRKWIAKCSPYAYDYRSVYSIYSQRRQLTRAMVYCRCLFRIFDLNKAVDKDGDIPWSNDKMQLEVNANLDGEEFCGKFR